MTYRLNIVIPSLDHPYCLAEFNVEMPGDVPDQGIPEINVGGVELEVIDVRWTIEKPPEATIERIFAEAYDSSPSTALLSRERKRRFSGPRCHVKARAASGGDMLAIAAAVVELDRAAAEREP